MTLLQRIRRPLAGRRPGRERAARPQVEERRRRPVDRAAADAGRGVDRAPGPVGLPGRRRARLLPPERGTTYRPETFKDALTAALKAAGVEKQPRAFHDLRHTAITNDAAAGSSPIAVMTKAGHADMATTKRYMHLTGVVFRDEADALERRLGLSTEPSTRRSAPQRTSDDSLGVAAPWRASAE
jgi:integrase